MRYALPTVALAAMLSGCFTRESAIVYARHEAGREQAVRMATVESVREVALQGKPTPIGALAGATTGGIAGSAVGGGRGSAVAGVLGATAGYVAGTLLEQRATRKAALEITYRLDSGELRTIVQEADLALKPGDRVHLLTSGGVTRVTLPGAPARVP